MSLQWTWWAGSARFSQIPASGSVQLAATWSADATTIRQVSR